MLNMFMISMKTNILFDCNLKEISPSVFSWKKNNKKTRMQFYCQNTIRLKKDTKLCLHVEKWSITSFFNFHTQLAESSCLCCFFVESVNVFVLPWFDFCTSNIFFINKQIRTCANAFPNVFTARSNEYWAGQHWILSWLEENQTATDFLRSSLFTYDIMKNFNCN